MSNTCEAFAASLLSLSLEAGSEDRVLNEIAEAGKAFTTEPAGLKLLSGYALTKDEKAKMLDALFYGKMDRYLLSTVKIMAERCIIGQYAHFARHYEKLYNEAKGILVVEACSDRELSEKQKEALTQRMAALTNKKIKLVTRVDPKVLGGLRIEYDGKRIDDTARRRLQNIASALARGEA